jgi:predicted PurR-regulated permease PerM
VTAPSPGGPSDAAAALAAIRSAAGANRSQRKGMILFRLLLVLLGFWVLRGFFSALAWAVVLAIATWPLYERFTTLFSPRRSRDLAPLLFTFLIALVFIVPFGVGVIEIWREMNGVVHWVTTAESSGVPVPELVAKLPYMAPQVTQWWMDNLAAPGAITDLIGRADTGHFARLTQEIGLIIARRLTFFAFTVLTLFFLFRDGAPLGKRFTILCNYLLGPPGGYIAAIAMSAIRGTADGLVLVGLGEGAFLGFAYVIFGVPHPALLGAFTGLLAMIPFGAPVVFLLAGAVLLIKGHIGAAIGMVVFSFIVIMIADHFIRPVLIGGAAKLPFLFVLLGIFGGLETFGLVGLFLGPAIMAALVSMWREWTDPAHRPPPAQTPIPPPQEVGTA